MGGIGSGVAVGLEVGKQRPQGGQLAADGAVGLASIGQGVSPCRNVLAPDTGQFLPGTGLDTGMGKELVEVALIRFTGMGGGATPLSTFLREIGLVRKAK